MYTYIYIYIYIYIYVCIYIYIYIYIHIYKYMYKRTHAMSASMCLYACWMYIHVFVYICIHTCGVAHARRCCQPPVCLSLSRLHGAKSPGANISVSNVRVCICLCIWHAYTCRTLVVGIVKQFAFKLSPSNSQNEEPQAACFACIDIFKRFSKHRNTVVNPLVVLA